MRYSEILRVAARNFVLCFLLFSLVSAEAGAQLPSDTLPTKLVHDQIPIGFETLPATTKNNPVTQAKVTLGRKLFFDPVLSYNGEISCASCHQPDHGFASPDALAIGVDGKRGTRNAPTLLNVAYATSFNWDGRSETLESQVVGPLTSEVEMGNQSMQEVVDRLNEIDEYVTQFSNVFDGQSNRITEKQLVQALASFQRALIRGGNSVDRFRRQEYAALSKSARAGMWIFESRGGCWKCHSGSNLSDNDFHNTGVSFGIANRDLGREQATQKAAHRFQFRTPSLRNVALTPPYMHDGSIKTLKDVVEFYNKGGSQEDPGLDKKMQPLNLTETEVEYLVAFLESLNSRPYKKASSSDSTTQNAVNQPDTKSGDAP